MMLRVELLQQVKTAVIYSGRSRLAVKLTTACSSLSGRSRKDFSWWCLVSSASFHLVNSGEESTFPVRAAWRVAAFFLGRVQPV